MKRSPWRYLWTASDIRRKLLITLGLLIIYRIAAHVPVPGADPSAMAASATSGAGNTLMGILDMLSGGTVSNFSVLAMGVYPYITAQIILQLLVPIFPALEKRMKEDPREGQKWMERWTYLLAIPMAALQAVGQIALVNSMFTTPVVDNFSLVGANWLASWTIVIAMTGGTMFAIWLGELISEYGVRGQGLSLIIFAGIIARIPVTIMQILSDQERALISGIFMIIFTVAVVFAIIVVQQGRRNVKVIYPGRRIGRFGSGVPESRLPLMVNMAGMIPLIFAQAILTFPAFLAGPFVTSETEWVRNLATGVSSTFGGGGNLYFILYFSMVVLFTFFYTDVIFQQQNYGDNLKRQGAQIPGKTPGKKTQDYLLKVQRYITLPGALFLGLVAVLPWLIGLIIPFGANTGLLAVNSSGMLIVVGVIRDLFYNIEAELRLHGYEDNLLVR